MGRNWMDAVCIKCSKNNGIDFPFRVQTGDPLRCPRCGRPTIEGPTLAESLKSQPQEGAQEGKKLIPSKERK